MQTTKVSAGPRWAAAAIIFIAAASAALPAAARLANIATRGRVLAGDSVLIGGFTIGGSSAKKVLVTARGPSLATQGVPGTLADPFLTLYSGATPIATNDDFGSAANAGDIPSSMRPGNAKEAAILTTLEPGAYTAIVTGVGGATGVAIVEVFEVDTPDSPLVNIATRGPVQTGDNVLIGGVIIQGDAPQSVLVTARGPSLGVPPHNVPGTLADPVLQVLSGQTVVASNDDWETSANAASIRATGVAPTNAKEAAVLTTLNPGAYTVIVTGSGGTTGIGIVEVFAVSNPPTGVAIAQVDAQSLGGNAFASSTKLRASWTAPSGYLVDHYVITATDAVSGSSLTFTAAGTAISAQLTGLKSATAYSVVVSACEDADCSRRGNAAAVAGTTSEEYWQLQGTGNTVAGLTKVVSDGNVRVAVLRYGADAPDAVKNRLQLYYGPNSLGTRSGLATALSAAVVDESVPSTLLSFVSGAGTTGLQNPTSSAMLVKQVMTGQAVPLAAAAGAKVRLYFEGNGQDGRTRILSLDSQDGYVGRDFHAGGSSVCQTAEDYSTGGGCAPAVVIAVESDAGGNAKIANARQFKIGYPMQSDWRWDEAVGTFMVFTVDAITGCTTAGHNQAYAQWTGSRWDVKYETNGCPKLMTFMQAATPVHLGGVRYKLYYGDRTDDTGKLPGSTLPFLGPKRVLYADGAKAGAATTVEFEDWEATNAGRGVSFLWPSGELLDATAEGYIDDFMAVAPAGSLDTQVFYVAITDGTIPPFVAGALLLNP